jgi:hypothetical protein
MENNVVDIAEYRKSPPDAPSDVTRFSPIRAAGWIMSAASAGFMLYVVLRAAELGVFDDVIAVLLAANALLVLAGLGLVRASGSSHTWPLTRKLTRAGEASPEASVASVISFEAVQGIRSPVGRPDLTTCKECGTVFSSRNDECPACGEVRRVA